MEEKRFVTVQIGRGEMAQIRVMAPDMVSKFLDSQEKVIERLVVRGVSRDTAENKLAAKVIGPTDA